MKRFFIFALLVAYVFLCNAQSPTFQWANQFGSVNGDQGWAQIIDNAGNVYSTGIFNGTVDFDPGAGVFNLTSSSAGSVFILKLDSSGNLIWVKKIAGITTGVVLAECIDVDNSGNVYIGGSFDGAIDFDPNVGTVSLVNSSVLDGYVLKLTSSGAFSWVKQLKTLSSTCSFRMLAIKVDNFGNVYSTGTHNCSLDFDPGTPVYTISSSGVYLLKLNNLGNFVWANSIAGNDNTYEDWGHSLAFDNAGNLLVAGYFGDIEDFDPTGGTYYLASTYRNGFVAKYDASGNLIWAQKIGNDSGDVFLVSMTIDNADNILVTGQFSGPQDFDPSLGVYTIPSNSGSYDIFIEKLDPSGNFLWAMGTGSASIDYGQSVAVDQYGNVYTTGVFSNTVDFDPGPGVSALIDPGSGTMFISMLDINGNFLWAGEIESYAAVSSINVDQYGSIYATGSFQYTVDFNPDVVNFYLTSAGLFDAFVLKLNQPFFGVNENSFFHNSITLYPNPTSNFLTIKTVISTHISIVNLFGQELFNSKIEKSQTIDVSFLSNGIYFVKDLQNGGSVKFVKQ